MALSTTRRTAAIVAALRSIPSVRTAHAWAAQRDQGLCRPATIDNALKDSLISLIRPGRYLTKYRERCRYPLHRATCVPSEELSGGLKSVCAIIDREMIQSFRSFLNGWQLD